MKLTPEHESIIKAASILKKMKWAAMLNTWTIPDEFGGGTWKWKDDKHDYISTMIRLLRQPDKYQLWYWNTRARHNGMTTSEYLDWWEVHHGNPSKGQIMRDRKRKIREIDKECKLTTEERAHFLKHGIFEVNLKV